jgi:DNA-binding response OmpR family regulator
MVLNFVSQQPRCLIAEDQALIGMGLEATLEDIGIAVAGPFPSCSEALAWIECDRPEVAIIDYKLKDGPCTELVKALLGQGVPIIIYSGFPQDSDIPPELCGLMWLEKPTACADLLAAMAQVAPAIADHIASPAQS